MRQIIKFGSELVEGLFIVGICVVIGWGLAWFLKYTPMNSGVVLPKAVAMGKSPNTAKKAGKEAVLVSYSDVLTYLKDSTTIPFARTFTAISILESGWLYESYGATVHHNIFGMNYSVFASKRNAVRYLEEWVAMSPPTAKELEDPTGFEYLKRRGYNPYVGVYYPRLASVMGLMK